MRRLLSAEVLCPVIFCAFFAGLLLAGLRFFCYVTALQQAIPFN